MQIIFQGQTDHCHPKFKFLQEGSVNHWLNEEKVIELIAKTFLPYVRYKKEELDLNSAKTWLLIADEFKGQSKNEVKSLIEELHRKMVPVAHDITNYFQPLELTVNQSCKSFLHDKAQIWYAEQVQTQISKLLQKVYLLI